MTFSETLRAAIEADKRSRYLLARESGVTQASLCRFMDGTRGLTTATLDRLVPVLGLALTQTPRRRKPCRKTKTKSM